MTLNLNIFRSFSANKTLNIFQKRSVLHWLMALTCSISRYVHSAAQALYSSVLLLTETWVKTDYRWSLKWSAVLPCNV